MWEARSDFLGGASLFCIFQGGFFGVLGCPLLLSSGGTGPLSSTVPLQGPGRGALSFGLRNMVAFRSKHGPYHGDKTFQDRHHSMGIQISLNPSRRMPGFPDPAMVCQSPNPPATRLQIASIEVEALGCTPYPVRV